MMRMAALAASITACIAIAATPVAAQASPDKTYVNTLNDARVIETPRPVMRCPCRAIEQRRTS
jgi:hypothetical protein